jgi:hypothetical protein
MAISNILEGPDKQIMLTDVMTEVLRYMPSMLTDTSPNVRLSACLFFTRVAEFHHEVFDNY